jgi:hypothetical protein
MSNMLDFQDREDRILAKFKSGEVTTQDLPAKVVEEFVNAKQVLKVNVLADTFGGLMGPDALGAATSEAGARYERALAALEEAVGLGSSSGVTASDGGDNV